MSESLARLYVTQEKDVVAVEFTDNKILDELNINEIGQALTTLVEAKDRPKLLLDFANVDHMSSAALGMLININKGLKARNGQLRLANIKPPILEVFAITKMNKVFRISPTRAQALETFE